MGILNVTPDSFFENSRAINSEAILEKTSKMLSEGATFIDIGGHSTRPGAAAVSENEEMDRVLPAIEVILEKFPDCFISIDTFRASVAKKAVELGAALVNDVSGGLMDADMYKTVAELNVPYILMHMRGNIDTMMEHTNYNNLVLDVLNDLEQKVGDLRKYGQKDIIIDLGFGFSKTADQNYELLHKLDGFEMLECPILVGISRKSMIWRKLGIKADAALNGTTALNTVAILNGANILRVHDVKEAMETIKLVGLVTQL